MNDFQILYVDHACRSSMIKGKFGVDRLIKVGKEASLAKSQTGSL